MKKILLRVFGAVSLGLGIAGIFLPLLPTTPFLLLTAFLWARSSPRLYAWLMNHPHFGEYIRDFSQNRAIPLRAKIVSVSMIWITITYSIIVVRFWALKIMLFIIAAAVTRHVLSFKTKK